MKRSALILLLSLATFSHDAGAQQASPLNETQTTGRTLFAQSCVVCHVKVQLGTGGHYGPALSRMSLGGQEAVMRELISNGTPNMPGFKYHFKPDQIEAIVAYLKTLPTP